jgi:3-oxoacyl-[acyl-carrier protein] reductase
MSAPLLDGKVAVITGSTRGIGRAMAEAFAADGARVVINGRRQEDAEAVAAAIPGSLAIGGDMADQQAIDGLVAETRSSLGSIDILVNNAAISRRSAITRVTDDEWNDVIRVNLTGPMALSRAVIPVMKEQRSGTILNVISGAATHGSIGFSSYAASKGGLLGLTMTWAVELAPFRIRVNALTPSAMTDMMRQLPPDVIKELESKLPAPEDVAGTALFLVSDLAKTVTGQVVQASTRLPA